MALRARSSGTGAGPNPNPNPDPDPDPNPNPNPNPNQLFLDRGSDCMIENNNGWTVLHTAVNTDKVC